MTISTVFDHAEVWEMGCKAAKAGDPRVVPAAWLGKVHQGSQDDFQRSWLQGFDSLDVKAPWES